MGIKPTVSDKMVSYITGSKFAQKNLSIVLGEGRLKGEQVLGGLLQGRRGVVFLGDFGTEGQDKGLD